MMDPDEAVERFLEGQPGSAELGEWRATLQERLTALRQERELGHPDQAGRLEREIRKLEKQIDALAAEEAITGFVEESVRVTLAMGSVVETGDEE